MDSRRAVLHCSNDCCRRNHSPSRQRRLESDAENRCCGRDRHHSDGFLLRIMPSPWRPVPACVDHDIPQAGHSPLRQRRMESDADLVVATASEGGPFYCAGENHCSDSQIHPLKSRIAARRRANPGHSLQRCSSLTPEIRNHCTQEVVKGHNHAAIPKFTP